MSNVYLIDGYNLMHCMPDLVRLANQHLEAAREKLAERIAKWCDSTDFDVQLIFDGQGRRSEKKSHNRPDGRLTVIFTSHEQSADALIERAVYRTAAKESVIVVSADRGITDLCLGMGAIVMNPKYFLVTLNETDQQVADTIKARQRKSEGFGRIEEQLGGGSLDSLKELRDRLKED